MSDTGSTPIQGVIAPSPLAAAVPRPSAVRAELEDLVVKELLGPAGGPHEEVDEPRVSDRYLIGQLAPRRSVVRAAESDTLSADGAGTIEDGGADDPALPIDSLAPAAIGLTCTVHGECAQLLVTPRWGRYVREKSEQATTASGNPKTVWRRYPAGGRPLPVALAEGDIAAMPADPEQPDVVVRGRVRRLEGDWVVSLFLVNAQAIAGRRPNDAEVVFQPELEVAAPDGAPVFHKRRRQSGAPTDEQRRLEMLYRRQVEFAVGHGVAVSAEVSADSPAAAVRLTTRVAPTYEVPTTTPPGVQDNPALAGVVLDMQGLAEMPAAELLASLRVLTASYGQWIEERQARVDTGADGLDVFEATARQALDDCREARQRVEAGVHLLETDPQALEAFRFANRAMWQQRIHALCAERRRAGVDTTPEALDQPGNRSWRPFQLAFVLLNLPGVTRLDHPDRSEHASALADLIWFPTGGGKTEAYLAAMAYHMFRERLVMADGGDPLPRDGTNVLMRYTLRMLTTQQFQRAASLICAMERIRREPGRWGIQSMPGRRFSLGLWVGGDGSPNRISEARSAMTAYRNAKSNGNPLVLTECPWCRCSIGRVPAGKGHELAGIFDHRDEGPRLLCPDSSCDFGAEDPQRWLPVEVIDERIYQSPPSLVIATADKLAMTAYRPEARALFGLEARQGTVVRASCPPGLIIQDELHLISGPLGTMYALYEGIFERLCSYEVNGVTVRPKIIASTATIRGAGEQVMALYGRKETRLFPSPGLAHKPPTTTEADAGQPPALAPGRLYLGIHAPNYSSILTTQVRVLSSLAARVGQLAACERDPWWTLLAFYNSIRELGGAKTLFDSDIRSRLKFMFNRENFSANNRRLLRVVEELTSRLSQADIVMMMDRLSTPYSPSENTATLDACLASSIIEVGVDIDRLSLMGVVGQPKTTATYIQVTGRVGRRWLERPGLILMVYNPSKSRDRSHFEQFHSYHRRLYERVEPTTATPFALSALERGLAGAVLAWARQNGTGPVNNPTEYSEHLEEAYHLLRDRCNTAQAAEDMERSLAELERRFAELRWKWSQNPQEWEKYPPSLNGEYLMLWPGQFYSGIQKRRGASVPSSMRQVDRSGELQITQGYVPTMAAMATPGAGTAPLPNP